MIIKLEKKKNVMGGRSLYNNHAINFNWFNNPVVIEIFFIFIKTVHKRAGRIEIKVHTFSNT